MTGKLEQRVDALEASIGRPVDFEREARCYARGHAWRESIAEVEAEYTREVGRALNDFEREFLDRFAARVAVLRVEEETLLPVSRTS